MAAPIIGIDLGTTNSLVAVLRGETAETLPNEMGEHLTPSAVAIAKDGGQLVGRPAWDRIVQNADSGRAFFKRDMGTGTTYRFGGRTWTPTECSAVVLNEMKRIAQLHLGGEVAQAVITVPAYFRESQRQATAEAARLAGLTVARILNEPTAAALAYGYRNPESDSKLLVFDLGGGTFDVTILEVFSGVIEVRASGGESRLGGEDFTDALLDMLLKEIGSNTERPDRGTLRAQAETLKRRLSARASVPLVLDGHELVVTRQQFEAACAPLTSRLHPVVLRCLRDAGVSPQELTGVLLVGGASRMHMVGHYLEKELGTPGLLKLDPDRVVALGAAVQAGLCAGDSAVQDLVLTDVCAHTLGIGIAKEFAPGHRVPGYYEPLIERNTTVPASRAKPFSAFHPEQDEILVEVYQGEARMVKDNHLLGTLRVTGLKQPPGVKEPADIEVRFTYDMSGLLDVDVTVVRTGKTFSTTIQERPGALTAAQVEQIRTRLKPLKISLRDRVHHRARLERAQRVYTQLSGDRREMLAEMLDQFERLLSRELEAEAEALGRELDVFLSAHALEEGEWQPPAEGNAGGGGRPGGEGDRGQPA